MENTSSTSTKTNKPETSDGSRAEGAGAEADKLSQVISYIMILLTDTYPFQFKQAYVSLEDRTRARNIWMTALKGIPPQRIKKAAEKAIRSGNKFMPSLGDIIGFCQFSYEELGLKQPLTAYYEACHSGGESRHHSWSHPAVYFAAKATGWFWLREGEQSSVFPLFERNYAILCQRVQDGEDLQEEIKPGLENFAARDVMRKTEDKIRHDQQCIMKEQGIDPSAGRQAFRDAIKELT